MTANLVAVGLVQDSELFLNYLRYFGLDAQLEAGDFLLDPTWPLPELAAALTDAQAPDITLRFIEGWRLEEMADSLRQIQPGYIDADEFQAIVQRQSAFDLSQYDFLASLPPDATLEGYLFPDTYRVPLEADAAYLEQVRDTYLQLSQRQPNWSVVTLTSDAQLRSIDAVANDVLQRVQPLLTTR
ncbi:MAG: hypothetical protein HC804_05045 [Anaerolineae bacterium]|nr:hypothetical protein [Anaerolineae bacterium]